MRGRTRRSLLGQLLAAAGLLGAGAAGSAAASTAPTRGLELTLHADSVESGDAAGDLGGSHERGDQLTVGAELLDELGATAGRFYAAAFALKGPGAPPAGAESLELHTFELADGTIIGSGAAGRLEGEFAVLGGTGRFSTARGSYVISRDGDDFDDAGAEFVISLVL